jgi:hypothetical protein
MRLLLTTTNKNGVPYIPVRYKEESDPRSIRPSLYANCDSLPTHTHGEPKILSNSRHHGVYSRIFAGNAVLVH